MTLIIELAGFAATILGSTWHLSSKLTNIQRDAKDALGEIRAHTADDKMKFFEVNRSLTALMLKVGLGFTVGGGSDTVSLPSSQASER